MHEAPTGSATRRPLRDAGYAVGLLVLAIASGYGVLAPDRVGLATAAPMPTPVSGVRTSAATGASLAETPTAAEPRPAHAAQPVLTARLTEPRRESIRPTPDAPPIAISFVFALTSCARWSMSI